MTDPNDAPRPPLGPRHWPAWLGIGAMALLARIPWPLQRASGSGLGALLRMAMAGRRRIAARNCSNWAASTGKSPQKTTGCAGRKPGSIAAVGFLSSVIVSPTRVSATSLIEAVRKPISPGPSSSTSTFFGVITPTRSTS